MNRNEAQECVTPGRSNGFSASWVIREVASGRVICETFSKRAVDNLNTAKYEAVPILDYLVEINAAARNQH